MVFVLAGGLTLAWRTRAWWLGWALLWLILAPPEPAPLWLVGLVAAGALRWWPPVRWAWSVLRGGGGMGGVRVKDEGRRTPAGRVELLSLGGEPRPRRWAVSALVPFGPWPHWTLGLEWPPLRRVEQGYVTAILGSGGTGKSYLLLTLGMALLTGGTWLGRRVLRLRSVLYVDAELDTDTQKERAYQVARGMGLRRPPGPSRWWQLPWARWPGRRPWGLHYYKLPCSVASAEGLALVERQVRRVRAEAVLFDSLTIGSLGIGLSDPNGWNAVLTGMEAWRVPTVLIDHMPKSGGTMVGSFMKQAKVRSAVALEREERTGAVTVTHEKANFGPLLPAFRMRPVFEHGDPDDPEPATVRFELLGGTPAQASPTDESPTPAATAGPRWSAQTQAVLEGYAAAGPGGATCKAVAEGLGCAYKAAWEATRRLEGAKALRPAGTVPTPGGGPPARVYVATGQDARADAVSQVEQFLRTHRSHPPGGAGGAGEA